MYATMIMTIMVAMWLAVILIMPMVAILNLMVFAATTPEGKVVDAGDVDDNGDDDNDAAGDDDGDDYDYVDVDDDEEL